MAGERDGGPAELVLLASVARRYYLAGRSKVEIGEEFELSRFQVARLLDKAHASGLVRIEIGRPGAIDLETSSRLQDAYGLRHAVVVEASAEAGGPLRTQLGAAAAELLSEIVTAQDVLGVAWARAVSAMAGALGELAPVPVVQLTGSLSGREVDDSVDSSVEIVRALSRVSGGPAYFFYAPMVVPKAATARALRQQPEVARAFCRFGTVTKAVVGIGIWRPGESTLYDAATAADRRRLTELGVCAEFSGVLVSEDGTVVATELAERMITLTPDEMRVIPEVIGLPYGAEKAPAVRAALRSGLVTSLVTHDSLAHALLAPA